MCKRNVLIICFSQLHKDPRVLKQIDALKGSNRLFTAGYSSSGYTEVIRHFEASPHISSNLFMKGWRLLLLLTRRFEKYYWDKQKRELFQQLKNQEFDVLIANDLDVLPFCAKLSKQCGAKLIFDAHEYYPAHFQEVWKWRVLFQSYQDYLCKKYFADIAEFLVVGENIGNLYRTNYGVNKYTVITNAPAYHDLVPSQTEEKIKMIHHGNATRSRRIEEMIKLLDLLPQHYELHLMLVKSDVNYYDQLKRIATGRNVKFQDPVPTNEIVSYINKFDIGLYILPPLNFNSRYALPNKFFEFIQARLMIAIGPSVEMKDVVEKYHLGIVSNDFTAEAMAEQIKPLTRKNIMQYKQNTTPAALELNAEHNARHLNEIMDKIAG